MEETAEMGVTAEIETQEMEGQEQLSEDACRMGSRLSLALAACMAILHQCTARHLDMVRLQAMVPEAVMVCLLQAMACHLLVTACHLRATACHRQATRARSEDMALHQMVCHLPSTAEGKVTMAKAAEICSLPWATAKATTVRIMGMKDQVIVAIEVTEVTEVTEAVIVAAIEAVTEVVTEVVTEAVTVAATAIMDEGERGRLLPLFSAADATVAFAVNESMVMHVR
jgi:hypothetical protein